MLKYTKMYSSDKEQNSIIEQSIGYETNSLSTGQCPISYNITTYFSFIINAPCLIRGYITR